MDIRLADHKDKKNIAALLRSEQDRFLRIPISDIDDVLTSRLAIKATKDDRLVGCLLSIWSNPPSGWLDAIAIEDSANWSEVFAALLRTFEGYLALNGVTEVFCSVEDGTDGMVRLALQEQGYRQRTRFVRYEKLDFVVPFFRPPRITIRPVQPDDLARLASIEKASFPFPWQMDIKALDRAANRYDCFRVAENARREIVGYHCSDVKDTTGYFVHLAVSSSARGINIGKGLLSDAIAHFYKRDVQRIEIRTEQSNQTARRLYRFFGFQQAGLSRSILAKSLGPSSPQQR